ncbi:MAG TPA: hypothetical protein VJV03_16070 [Pyrinomonadaceae bacterium]|nr:hypothetical protein [Pyrinomonadaceae bacterium]
MSCDSLDWWIEREWAVIVVQARRGSKREWAVGSDQWAVGGNFGNKRAQLVTA